MAETIVSKVQRGGAKLESRGAKHPLAPPQIRLCWTLSQILAATFHCLLTHRMAEFNVHYSTKMRCVVLQSTCAVIK